MDSNHKAPRRRRAAFIMIGGGYANAVISTVQGLVLLPLYLYYVGDRLYGLWLATGGVLAVLGCLDVGLASLLIQRISKSYAQNDPDKVASYFVNGLIYYSVLMSALVLIASALSFFVPGMFNASLEEAEILRECFILAALGLALSLLNNAVAGFQQALQRPLFMQFSTTICSIIGLGATVVMLYLGVGLRSIPLGFLARNIPLILSNFIFDLHLLKQLRAAIRFDFGVIREIRGLSLALFASKLGSSAAGQIEPALIAYFIRPELATSFVVTKKVTAIIDYCLNTIISSVFPGFAHLYGEGNKVRAAQVYMQIATMICCLSAVAYSLYLAGNHAFIDLWVGNQQFAGQTVTLLIALGCFFATLLNFNFYFISATGDIKVPSLINAAESVFRLCLMAVLLNMVGIIGLPLAIIISSIVFYICVSRRMQNHFPSKLLTLRDTLRLFLVCSVLFAIALGASSIPLCSWITLISYLIGLGIIFILIECATIPMVRSWLQGLVLQHKLFP
ncbi:MAG: oligosaccharide flippase family protein [Syntrophobacteraceae bacterium]